jgi:hypothetical protein
MKIGQYELTWGERSESVFAFLQISGPWKVRALFAIWMHDSMNLRCATIVTLYIEIFFIQFKVLTIEL